MSTSNSKGLNGKVHTSKIKFEDILESIDPKGPAQIIIFLIAAMVDTVVGWLVMFFLYGGRTPTFYCLSQMAVDDGFTLETMRHWDTAGNSSSLLWTSDVCTINGSSCAAVIFEPDATSVVTEYSLVCQLRYVPTLVTTLFMLGILFGAFVFGHVADVYGRRLTFYFLLFMIVTCLYIQALSISWEMFAAIRFFGGLFAGGMITIAYVIQMEFVGPKYRSACGALGFWQLGTIVLAGLGYAIRNWRYLSFTVAGMSTPMIIIMFLVPESPRWLIQRGRLEEATAIVERMAKRNKRHFPGIEIIQRVDTDNFNSKVYIRDLFRNKTSTKKTLILCFLWFNCAMTYYGLSINVRDIGGNSLINNTVLGAAEFLFMISAIFTAWRFGRKIPLLVYFVIAVVCLFTAAGLGKTDTDRNIVAGITAVGRGADAGAWITTCLLTAELFPTVIRTLSSGIASTTGRIGGVIAPQVVYLAILDSAVPGAFFGISSLMALVLALIFLPETKGKPLPDKLPPIIGCCTREPEEEEEEEKQKIEHDGNFCTRL